jgi:hypothetical protein
MTTFGCRFGTLAAMAATVFPKIGAQNIEKRTQIAGRADVVLWRWDVLDYSERPWGLRRMANTPIS